MRDRIKRERVVRSPNVIQLDVRIEHARARPFPILRRKCSGARSEELPTRPGRALKRIKRGPIVIAEELRGRRFVGSCLRLSSDRGRDQAGRLQSAVQKVPKILATFKKKCKKKM
jgi:hypothetical protein